MRAKGRRQGNGKAGIVVRKEETVAGNEHNGAWKVAYADFVTAMMAFFLLMWLINATTEAQRKGLANYFAPTSVLSFHYSGAGKPFGGKTPFSQGQMVSDAGAVEAVKGEMQPEPATPPDAKAVQPGTRAPERGTARRVKVGPAAPFHPPAGGVAGPDIGGPALKPAAGESARADAAALQQKAFVHAAQQIRAMLKGNAALAGLARQIAIDITPAGLRIQILDGKKRPMFALGSAELAPPAEQFMARLAPILARLSGAIAISGYTDAAPYHGNGMSNWELSTERANAARSLLVASGLPGGRVVRVSGHADHDLLLPAEPLAAENRRVAVLVERIRPAAPGGTAQVPAPATP